MSWAAADIVLDSVDTDTIKRLAWPTHCARTCPFSNWRRRASRLRSFPRRSPTQPIWARRCFPCEGQNLIAYPSDELREHFLNAVGIETPSRVRMVKNKCTKKIRQLPSPWLPYQPRRDVEVDTSAIAMFGERTISSTRWYNSDRPASEASQINRMWDTDLEGQRAVPKVTSYRQSTTRAAATTRSHQVAI